MSDRHKSRRYRWGGGGGTCAAQNAGTHERAVSPNVNGAANYVRRNSG